MADVAAVVAAGAMTAAPAPAGASTEVQPGATGMLDCNGLSKVQRTLRPALVCSDPRSLFDSKPTRFSPWTGTNARLPTPLEDDTERR
jgi:hypothetical protein